MMKNNYIVGVFIFCKKMEEKESHVKTFFRTRWINVWDVFYCEWCMTELFFTDRKRWKVAVDIHHILSSFKWKRKHRDDWSDIIALCREHHEEAHNNNSYENREILLYVVSWILENYYKKNSLFTINISKNENSWITYCV